MKSKFVRLLIVINGILLFPILIFLLFELVNDKFKKDSNEFLEYETPIVKESIEENNDYKIRFSSVVKIPNSENHIVAEYKDLGNNAILEREIELPYSVPTFTYNLIFLDKNLWLFDAYLLISFLNRKNTNARVQGFFPCNVTLKI